MAGSVLGANPGHAILADKPEDGKVGLELLHDWIRGVENVVNVSNHQAAPRGNDVSRIF